jgi:hypothetical protein
MAPCGRARKALIFGGLGGMWEGAVIKTCPDMRICGRGQDLTVAGVGAPSG